MPLQPGEKLGPYEILAPHGAGGMGRSHGVRQRGNEGLKIAFADQRRKANHSRQQPGWAAIQKWSTNGQKRVITSDKSRSVEETGTRSAPVPAQSHGAGNVRRPVLRKPVAMPVLSAIQFRKAESAAVGSLRCRCEIVRFGKPQNRAGRAGRYTLPYAVFRSLPRNANFRKPCHCPIRRSLTIPITRTPSQTAAHGSCPKVYSPVRLI